MLFGSYTKASIDTVCSFFVDDCILVDDFLTYPQTNSSFR
jgi:hypothetical protein